MLRFLFEQDRRFRIGLILLFILILLVILSFISPYDSRAMSMVATDQPPSFAHLFGTNSVGQDLFWNMAFAVRHSLLLGLVVAAITRIISSIIGLTAGYLGGIGDRMLMTIDDGFIVIPALPILILLSFVLRGRANLLTLALTISIFGWAWDGRLIRSLALSLREREFSHFARYSGMNVRKIIYHEYAPFVLPLIMATTMTNMLWSMGMEITLSVFGLSNLETPTIGTAIHWAMEYQSFLRGIWWWLAAPIAISIILFVSLFLLSTSISEYVDPRKRAEMVRNEKR